MNLYPAKASRSWTVVALIIAVIWLFPILFALGTSFRPLQDVFANVVNFIPIPPTLENYAKLAGRLDLPRVIANTFSIAATVTLLKLLTAFLAAYAFTYFEFRGRNKIYFVFLATIFVPFTVTMIPNYLLIARIGLGDNILGVILTQVADASGILLMVAAMREIPYSLIESAKLDDVSDRRIMLDMVLPLVRPQLTATGIWFFVNSWNEFVWPSLILRSEQSYTLPLALQMFVSAEGGTDFAVAMAVSVVTMLIPVVLYLTFQKYIIGTFTGAGIK
ncbi:carbohydrate ABC transporter permease [Granulicoccus phenolivorans]|uniref:carbohydrate ABC transporter permease n=1 Tax=Granulicoccus phenolivorans TaxID=266854 RepID=UPI00040DDBC6|nr:carbohydrate ABC transporter permease [Granulicoccus phenolivorans]